MKVSLLALLPLAAGACPAGTLEVALSFDGFANGDYVSDVGSNVVVSATSNSGGFVANGPRIYDTDTPGAGLDPDLEVGAGNVLIIQQDDTVKPNDHAFGGSIRFRFPQNVTLKSVDVVDIETKSFLVAKSGTAVAARKTIPGGPDGSVVNVPVTSMPLMDSLRIKLKESGGVKRVTTCWTCPPGLVYTEYSLAGFVHGDYVTSLASGVTLSATGPHPAYTDLGPRIYDTNTTGGADPDLEVGIGNVLIIQNSDKPQPDDSRKGGFIIADFTRPIYALGIKIVDFEQAGEILTTAGDVTTPSTGDGGVATVGMAVDGVTQIRIRLKGSGGVQTIATCEAP